MGKFHYGDIPERFVMKEYYPLGRHTWHVFEELGTDYWDVGINALSRPGALNDFFMARLDNSIETSKLVMNGTISEKDSQNMFTYSLFPPIFCIRSDLQQGFQKLMLGESVDATFILLDDQVQEMFFALNTHQEDGIPVDWFNIDPTDEILDRRHMKYGYKLREFPKKMKNNLPKISKAIIDILKDIRNERTPEWSTSDYIIAIAWMGAAVNSIYIVSNFEAIVSLQDYFNAKRVYKLPMEWVGFFPQPPILNSFMFMDRPSFGNRFGGLTSGNNLYMAGMEEYWYDWSMKELPEMMKLTFYRAWGAECKPEDKYSGTLYPAAEGHYEPPIFKKKEIYENEEFDFTFLKKEYAKYPKLSLETFNLDFETARKGVYTDINNLTTDKEEISEKNIISLGLAKDTKNVKK
ncbi:MAG: hypothetical protein EAX96_10305 [Candidatus Lokiarchaeota archaeon]|nr:hypothetical protein [Candidatus Lokiarchaeota archaeon]